LFLSNIEEAFVHHIDIVIVAARRPELLERTLSSFQKYIFNNFSINTVSINIDPFGGVEKETGLVRDIVQSYFPSVKIFTPDTANFTASVRRLWKNTTSDYVLHMEDDWQALGEITPEMVFPQLKGDVKTLSIMNKAKCWNGKQVFHYPFRRKGVLPFKSENTSKPYFTTSPSFWNGDFLRKCGTLMVEQFDPEKQFYSDVNSPLEDFVKPFKNKFLIGENTSKEYKFLGRKEKHHLIQDIGREWRLERNIEKLLINNQSVWKEMSSEDKS